MTDQKTITVTSPLLPNVKEFEALLEDIFSRKWLTNNGHYHRELENALAEYLGVPYLSLFTNGKGVYWFKVSRGFPTALNESLSSLETLIDETAIALSSEQKTKVNLIYRKLNSLYE